MRFNKELKFNYQEYKCIFKTLAMNDVTESYITGLKNQKIYLVNNPEEINIKWQQNYIKKILQSEEDIIYGLFVNDILVGTAGLQNIVKNKLATIGIFIFDHESRGKGFGKTLVWCSCFLTYNCININYFGAGMEKNNIPSLKSFLSCGFKIVNENEDNYYVKLNIEELQKPKGIDNITIENIY